MAQTKRKRRTKHRGNAAGMVESRGRTGKRSAPTHPPAKNGRATTTSGRGSRNAVALKPPTLKSAALKALFGVVILFVFFRFLSHRNTTGEALLFCAVAYLLYTPVMYWTDKFVYNRKLRQRAK